MFVKLFFIWARKGILIVALVTAFMTLLSFSWEAIEPQPTVDSLDVMSNHLAIIQSMIKTDSLRLAAVHRIIRLIDTYNPKMDPKSKLEIANTIYEMSLKYSNLDVDLICATITHESAFTWRRDVVSPAGAMGLMQIMPHTGYLLSKQEGIPWTDAEQVLFDPVVNIKLGCRYLSFLIEHYHLDGGLAAYNGGERRAARWLASGRNDEVLFEETREYVPAVLKLYDTYRN